MQIDLLVCMMHCSSRYLLCERISFSYVDLESINGRVVHEHNWCFDIDIAETHLQDLTNSGLHQIILSDDLLMKKSAASKGEI